MCDENIKSPKVEENQEESLCNNNNKNELLQRSIVAAFSFEMQFTHRHYKAEEEGNGYSRKTGVRVIQTTTHTQG